MTITIQQAIKRARNCRRIAITLHDKRIARAAYDALREVRKHYGVKRSRNQLCGMDIIQAVKACIELDNILHDSK